MDSVESLMKASPVPAYSDIPKVFLDVLAERYAKGNARYGRLSWRAHLANPEYRRFRLDHAIAHLLDYANPEVSEESPLENLAAAAWGIALLIEGEMLKGEMLK